MEITQPFMVKHYNQTMECVDRMDQNVDKYSISIRSKKWWPLFAFCVDVSIQQAWHLYRATPAAETKPLDRLAVRRSITRVYLARATQTSSFGRLGRSFLAVNKWVLPGVRYDRTDHIIQSWKAQLKSGFCWGEKAYRRCKTCQVCVHDT